uniref:Uncharacterized protein n=1 Tax=Meloidogyne enterolobii TaxID=390850 RepID=A0A6V7VLP2_MELEN|nr:unnamed protein product [Meloidogyne enterolobii]
MHIFIYKCIFKKDCQKYVEAVELTRIEFRTKTKQKNPIDS